MADTPTSRVGSAPQGYVELFGKARLHPGITMTSPVSMRPCVWFRYCIEEQHDNKWREVGSGMSTDTFLLDDGTGKVVIDPDRAEIVSCDRRKWRNGPRRYTEWLLTPGGDLYALGELRTEGGSAACSGCLPYLRRGSVYFVSSALAREESFSRSMHTWRESPAGASSCLPN